MCLFGPLWLIAVALGETPSGTESDPRPHLEASPSDWMTEPFALVLEGAKNRYFRGDGATARRMLETLRLRITSGEAVEWPLVVDTLVYLGEIYYLDGEADRANDAFNYVLERDPETPISPYYHNLDVISVFETVRTKVIERLRQQITPPPPPPPEPTPTPATVVLPFGLAQFTQGRPGPGFVYGTLQAGFGATSLWYYFRLRNISREYGYPEGIGNEEVELLAQWRRERYFIQAPSTAAFVLMWGVSALDATRWHRRHPPTEDGERPVAVHVGPGQSPDGAPMLMLGGNF